MRKAVKCASYIGNNIVLFIYEHVSLCDAYYAPYIFPGAGIASGERGVRVRVLLGATFSHLHVIQIGLGVTQWVNW
jgi:hypothetical protein